MRRLVPRIALAFLTFVFGVTVALVLSAPRHESRARKANHSPQELLLLVRPQLHYHLRNPPVPTSKFWITNH